MSQTSPAFVPTPRSQQRARPQHTPRSVHRTAYTDVVCRGRVQHEPHRRLRAGGRGDHRLSPEELEDSQGQVRACLAACAREGPRQRYVLDVECVVDAVCADFFSFYCLHSGLGSRLRAPPSCYSLSVALLQYKPSDSRYARALGRFPKRNRFISDFIFDETGVRRTPKQVGSRLQQLKDVGCGKQREFSSCCLYPPPHLGEPRSASKTKLPPIIRVFDLVLNTQQCSTMLRAGHWLPLPMARPAHQVRARTTSISQFTTLVAVRLTPLPCRSSHTCSCHVVFSFPLSIHALIALDATT